MHRSYLYLGVDINTRAGLAQQLAGFLLAPKEIFQQAGYAVWQPASLVSDTTWPVAPEIRYTDHPDHGAICVRKAM